MRGIAPMEFFSGPGAVGAAGPIAGNDHYRGSSEDS
jgi:hypothetical protein